MKGDPEAMGRLTGAILLLFVAFVADLIWEVRKWLKK
jgi:hypothetical protein